jgi:hypothetical protein
MMEVMAPFLLGIGAIVGAIIGLKIFFTLWKIVDKRFHPEQFAKPSSTPETAFRGLRNKQVLIQLKNGETIKDCKYNTTLFFGDGEFGTSTLVYFEFQQQDGNKLYLCGTDIMKIETRR